MYRIHAIAVALVLATTLPVAVSAQTPFVDLGFGLPGNFGFTPLLEGEGTLLAGDPVTFSVSKSAKSTFAHLVVGAAPVMLPFKGGTLVPEVTLLFAGIPTRKGSVVISDLWPPGIPAGTTFFMQFWIEDSKGPQGFSASNALQVNVP